jgi:hypothetical protein
MSGSDISEFMPDDEVILETFRNNSEMLLESKEEIAPTPSWELDFSEKTMSAYVLWTKWPTGFWLIAVGP